MTDAPRGNDGPANIEPTLVLGVDGGGSKTQAWLARGAGDRVEVIGRAQAGSSNVRAIGADAALANLAAAIGEARQAAASTEAIDAAVLALAGSANREVRAAVDQWCAAQQIAGRVQVVHDARPVLAAGTPDDWGVALIAGTGSSAYALSADRQTVATTGGWGYLFGDEGSGYWIGRQALRRVGRADDRRDPPTALTEVLLDALQVSSPRELLTALAARGDLRQATARLAPCVLACAAEGDADACAIVDGAAEELSQLVAAAVRVIDAATDYPLAIAGGVLIGSALLRRQVADCLTKAGYPPRSIELVPEPVAGCVKMAQQSH